MTSELFTIILILLTLLSGGIWLVDSLIYGKQRKRARAQLMAAQSISAKEAAKRIPLPVWVEYAKSFFPVLLLVLVLRSFVVEPFRIPSSSLKPTLLVGDFVAVNRFAYGLRLPIVNKKIVPLGEPKPGDIVVFRWPVNPSIDYIKRVIGVPGDIIQYKNKQFYRNGEPVSQEFIRDTVTMDDNGIPWSVELRKEYLGNHSYFIYVRPDVDAEDFQLTVPEGHYFMVGDNRDGSADSRVWGFVPDKYLLGKAFIIGFSWDKSHNTVRWQRIGTRI